MGSEIDVEALLTACMADLGRERQDELPLNDETKRGPTFLPGKGTGVNHISKKVREKLSKGWGAKIDDGEARQMEGLEQEDARPWAKTSGRQPSRESLGISTRNAPNATSRSQHNPQDQAAKISSRPSAKTKQTTAVRAQQHCGSKTNFNAHGSVTKSLYPRVGEPNTKAKFGTQVQEDHILCHALGAFFAEKDNKSALPIEVALQANAITGRGYLIIYFQVGGKQKVHDILDLDPPTVEGATCRITYPRNRGEYAFNLVFHARDEAKDFSHYMKILQQSAAQSARIPSTTDHQAPSTSIKSEENSVNATNGISSDGQDMMRKMLVESLAINFHDMIRGVLSALVDCGVHISEDTMKTVQNTLFGHFDQLAVVNQKSSGSEVDDDLKQLLRAAVNVKLKVDVDRKESIVEQSPAIAALQSNEGVSEKGDHRIKYTAADILGLEKKEGDGEERRHDGSTLGKDNKPAAGKAKAKPKGLASSRWAKPSDGTASKPETTKALPLKLAPQTAESSGRPLMSPTSPSGAQGLSSSIWAGKPAEFPNLA